MPTIELNTRINASKSIVFHLSRSIDLHMHSMAHTAERAIAGRTAGLVEEGETVTWQARHLGITQRLTSHITDVTPESYFADQMLSGVFKRFKHEHHFISVEKDVTLMTDVFDYDSPLGILGKLADYIFLKKYMTRLLEHRNQILKTTAENGSWKNFEGMVEAVSIVDKTL